MATVLVVDDDPQARKPLVRLMEMEGHKVVSADNAVAAMAAAIDTNPCLILLDVGITPMDGLTFLFLLRERPQGKQIPVIVITGLDDEGTIRRAREQGVHEYLVKGHYKVPELLEIVRRYCPRVAEVKGG